MIAAVFVGKETLEKLLERSTQESIDLSGLKDKDGTALEEVFKSPNGISPDTAVAMRRLLTEWGKGQ